MEARTQKANRERPLKRYGFGSGLRGANHFGWNTGLLLIGITGGYKPEFLQGGFLIEIYTAFLFIYAVFMREKSYMPLFTRVAFVVFVLAEFVADLANHSPDELLLKGLYRNLAFMLCAWGGCFFYRKVGLTKTLLLYALLPIGNCVQIYMEGLWEGDPFDYINKYGGLSYGMVGVVLLFSRRWVWIVPTMVALVFVQLEADSRGPAVTYTIALMLASVLYLRSIIKTSSRWQISVGIALSLGVFGAIALRFQTLLNSIEHQGDSHFNSDVTRGEMARSAIDGILDNPILGRGTDSHATNFQSAFDQTQFVGVHSWLLQWGYEIGIIGILFGLYLAYIASFSIWRLFEIRMRFHSGCAAALIFISLTIWAGLLLSPFFGLNRVTTGYAIGCLLSFMVSAGRREQLKGMIPFNVQASSSRSSFGDACL